jgi:hypothetical protein
LIKRNRYPGDGSTTTTMVGKLVDALDLWITGSSDEVYAKLRELNEEFAQMG